MSKPDLIAEAKRLAGFAPEKPESVHDVVCAGFNALYEQLEAMREALRTADREASVARKVYTDALVASVRSAFVRNPDRHLLERRLDALADLARERSQESENPKEKP